jgi:hypothetical protein
LPASAQASWYNRFMRDQSWLEGRLADIWNNHFDDIAEKNPLIIRWGRRARTRLGSIRYDKKRNESRILMNALLKDEKVPQYVIDATIAHELSHYAHGFSSSHEQLYAHPHRGGIVDKELVNRGLGGALKSQQRWIKSNWLSLIREVPRVRRRRVRRVRYVLRFR